MRTVQSPISTRQFPGNFCRQTVTIHKNCNAQFHSLLGYVSSSTAAYLSSLKLYQPRLSLLLRQFIDMQEHLTYRVAHTFPVPGNGRPITLAINPEGTFVAVGCVSGGVLVWCLNTRDLVCQGSPPGCACGKCPVSITSMTWLEGGILFFGHCNGLVGVIRIGKVRWKLSSRRARLRTSLEVH